LNIYEGIEKCFSIIEKYFTSETLSKFKNAKINELDLYHFNLGLCIRNNLLHADRVKLCKCFIENGITHKDDMSHLMILLFHYYVCSK